MFILQDSPIDVHKAKHSCIDPMVGALVSFEGLVRSDMNKERDREVKSLLYMVDGPDCVNEGEKIIMEAIARFGLIHAVCIQRTGQVDVGEPATWIGAWASHRDEAFQGSRYIIEEIKKRLLIWKKENYTDGSSDWIRGQDTPKII